MNTRQIAVVLMLMIAPGPGVLAAGPLLAVATGKAHLDSGWRTASRGSAGIAPAPAAHDAAVVQVYAARAVSWRGAFGVHTWISVKDRGAARYRVYEVIGWRHFRGLPAVSISHRPPDGHWFGARPVVLADLRGARAEAAAASIDAVARRYRYTHDYRVWPGPNSNTFTAYVARQVPELRLHLPSTAIGKDFLGHWAAPSPSGTGYQFNVFGLFGMLVARVEGIEINLLGLTLGIDPSPLTIKLPGLGNLRLTGQDMH